jgi:hypothetical protein
VNGEAERRTKLEEDCLEWVRRYLADDAPMRSDMENFGRHLVSLSLDRHDGKAEIVADMTLDDDTSLTERYDIWTHDRPPTLDETHGAREAGFMIAVAITNL